MKIIVRKQESYMQEGINTSGNLCSSSRKWLLAAKKHGKKEGLSTKVPAEETKKELLKRQQSSYR